VVEPFAGDLDEYAAWLRTRASAQGARSKADRVEKSEPAPAVAPVAVAPAKPAGAKKPVNPHKLAAAEAKVSELTDAHWRRWMRSWPIRPTTPTRRRWRGWAASGRAWPSSWSRPNRCGWSCSTEPVPGRCQGVSTAPCACSHSRKRRAGSRSARERSRVSQ
jgi:hypothetical protein